MQKIAPVLWFDSQTEEVVEYYTSAFRNSVVHNLERYPDGSLEGPIAGMEGRVLNLDFELEGYRFKALDGGSQFQFKPAVSFFVNLNGKEEIDRLWDVLSEDGQSLMPLQEYPFSAWYGWVQDRYGLSWQLNLADEQVDQTIVPSLMFVGQQAGKAEEAIHFYSEVFEGAEIGNITRYGLGQGPDDEGTVAHARFKLADQSFAATDSAREHDFSFNEEVSFYVDCRDQGEVDTYWEALSAAPGTEQCGWLKDRYGLSWQIIPRRLGELMGDPDPEKAERVRKAMMRMKKIDIAGLEKAYHLV